MSITLSKPGRHRAPEQDSSSSRTIGRDGMTGSLVVITRSVELSCLPGRALVTVSRHRPVAGSATGS